MAVRHLGFLKIRIFNGRWGWDAENALPAKISWPPLPVYGASVYDDISNVRSRIWTYRLQLDLCLGNAEAEHW